MGEQCIETTNRACRIPDGALPMSAAISNFISTIQKNVKTKHYPVSVHLG